MTEAEKAYAAAERLIEEAILSQSIILDFSKLRALETLPPIPRVIVKGNIGKAEFAKLTAARRLAAKHAGTTESDFVAGPQETDATREVRYSSNTIQRLNFNNTKISDLTPIKGMTGIRVLDLRNTLVTNLAPISGMKGSIGLLLENTPIADLHDLPKDAQFGWLHLAGTRVSDLRPLLDVKVTQIDEFTLRVGNTPAAKSDPRIAEIDKMQDHKARVKALLDHLADGWVPAGEGPHILSYALPNRRPAPLEITVSDTQIAMADVPGLQASDASTRAAMGWEALYEHRRDFEADFNVSNYAPLPARLASFDRAMGTAYDPKNVIRIGVQAQRLVTLSQDANFTASLPDGAAGDLADLAAQMILYVERFPDWVAYRDDAEANDPPPLNEAAAHFNEISKQMTATAEVDRDVAEEYEAEVESATEDAATDTDTKALDASTREIARSLAEHETQQRKNRRALGRKGEKYIDKKVVEPMGVPYALLLKLEKPLRGLAKERPRTFGWLESFFDNLFGPSDNNN